jgi:hypothetical protein
LRRRFRDAADVRIEIEEAATSRIEAHDRRAEKPRPLIFALIAISLLTGCGLAYLAYRWIGSAEKKDQPTATYIKAPAQAISAFHQGFALSPDGQTLIFSARTADGRRQLWKRRLDELRSRPIAGTEQGMYAFWSPDGCQIGFYIPGELRRMLRL